MNRWKSVLMLLAAAAAAGAQTTISGNIGDMTLDSTGNPFIVEKDIVVPKGKSLTIKEGCAVLFKQFTGLTIQGSCTVNGTQDHPVVFTSINDAAYNKTTVQEAGAFDWNGITVEKKSGSVVFVCIDLRYSVYGIKSQNPGIVIRQSVFNHNGQFHFTMNEKIQNVQENQSFSFNDNPSVQGAAAPAPEKRAEPGKSNKVLRLSLLGVGSAGAVAGIITSINAASKYSDWKHIEEETDPLPAVGEYEKRQDKYQSALVPAIIFDIVGALGLAGFGITFAF